MMVTILRLPYLSWIILLVGARAAGEQIFFILSQLGLGTTLAASFRINE